MRPATGSLSNRCKQLPSSASISYQPANRHGLAHDPIPAILGPLSPGSRRATLKPRANSSAISRHAILQNSSIRRVSKPAPRWTSSFLQDCRVTQVQQLTRADGGALETWMVMGEVVAVHIDRALLRDGIYDAVSARPILRAGGPADYFEVLPQGRFTVYRPK